MKEILKRNKTLVTLIRKIRAAFGYDKQLLSINYHKKNSQALISAYLAKADVPRLQIGAQSNSIQGWLNVDIMPKSRDVAYMDATQPFPFADNTFRYIYSEHMIEHISFHEAEFMLRECFRVLKPNGKIRISTPNLAFLIDLYDTTKSIQRDYINYSTQHYLKNKMPAQDVYVINNFMRDWGHQFIHDEKSLSYLVTQNGFINVIRCQVMESTDIYLRQLEQHGKEISNIFNELESVIIEAVKP